MNSETISIIISLLGVGVSILAAMITASMRIGEYKNKVDHLETHVGKDEHCGMRKTLVDTKTEVDKLLEFKTNAQKFIDKTLYKDQSPLGLTDFGKMLVKESGFEDIFDTVKDDLANRLNNLQPKTQYDAQEMGRALMDELTDYPAFQTIKEYAFDHGKDFQQILRAGAILLRDYYISKHSDLPK